MSHNSAARAGGVHHEAVCTVVGVALGGGMRMDRQGDRETVNQSGVATSTAWVECIHHEAVGWLSWLTRQGRQAVRTTDIKTYKNQHRNSTEMWLGPPRQSSRTAAAWHFKRQS